MERAAAVQDADRPVSRIPGLARAGDRAPASARQRRRLSAYPRPTSGRHCIAACVSWNAEAKPAEIDEYLDKLRADDFVLALACTQGNERAWEGFIEKYRPVLYARGARVDP